MNLDELVQEARENKESRPICVLRLVTSYWSDKNAAHVKKTLRFVKRKSSGFQILSEDINCIGAKDVLERIINLDECEDGIYQVVTCNEKHDWETGYLDDYDYFLVKHEEKDL